MTDEQLDARFNAIDARFNAIDARFKAIDERFDRLIEFMAREFEAMRREIRAIDRRVDFLGQNVAGIQVALSGFTRHNETVETEMREVRGTQAGQQKVIDDLDRRVRRLEEKNGNPPKS